MRRPIFSGLAFALGVALCGAASGQPTIDLPLEEIGRYERDRFDRSLTDCDRLAAHPDDPEAVAPGVTSGGMDKAAAIAACRQAVAADPDNPRLRYQLGRSYGYSGLHEEALPHREAALRAGYPQSLFVMGYIRTTGWDGAEPDPCYGGELILRSARAGRFAGLVGFPHYAVLGTFDDCGAHPRYSAADLRELLDRAVGRTSDFYKLALIAQLRRALAPVP